MTMTLMKLAAILTIAMTEVRAQQTSRKIVISISDRKLVLLENGRITRVYPVAVGKSSTPSPRGEFHIVSHVINPTWYGPRQVVPPGPANPLGTRWMGIGYKGYGIHGTNAPRSIGKAASHGCIRMRKQDVEELFVLVSVGDEVTMMTEMPAEIAKLLTPVETASATAGE
jgi:lipoprotein-anchoring transpeptidase ErfK/SrfK